MRRLLLLLSIIWLTGCGKSKDLPEPMTPSAQLQVKFDRYVSLLQDIEQSFSANCDGALFASLTAAGAGREFTIDKWFGGDGKLFRSPDHDACKPTSRDMYLGTFWYAWSLKKVDLAEREFDYGLDHAFFMDARDKGISYLLEDEQFTLALIAHELHGKDYTVWKFPAPCTGKLTGFQGHLQALVIGVRALMDKGDDKADDCIREMADRQPNNAFFSAINGMYTGNQEHTVELLLSDKYFPADHLPTSAERCEPWLWQRDEGSDWEPCPAEGKTHTGGDFLVAAAIALGRMR